MTEEIKEILRFLSRSDWYKEADQLEDYIINLEEENENYRRLGFKHLAERNKELQQENEKLKENQSGFTLEDYTRLLNNYQELQKEHKNCTRKHWQEKCGEHHAKELIYKSRCEKAIEYVNNHQLVFELSSKKQIQQWFDEFYIDLLNILNGSDEK